MLSQLYKMRSLFISFFEEHQHPTARITMNTFHDTKPGLYPTLPAAEPDARARVSDVHESNSRDPHGINTHLQV